MTNRFTSTLQTCVSENPAISLRDLYYRSFINTIGSHVMAYNAKDYGDMYLENMSEFL